MASNTGVGATRVTICPACGYPRLGAGLCAACVPAAAAAAVNTTINTVAGESGYNPAA
jgi:hypothetical protein